MVNQELMDEFISKVKSKKILEFGLRSKAVSELKGRFDVMSFDPGTSTFAMIPKGFRASAMMRLPFFDRSFGGSVMSGAFGSVGDRGFFMKEIIRVVDGPMLFLEPSMDSFPIDFLSDDDSLNVVSASSNGKYMEINMSWADLISKRDFRRMFRGPGSSLNKFNQLVPEDITLDIGVLCIREGR